ncbi:hypothetical protein Tco_0469591 [Tanacetum coccineum]
MQRPIRWADNDPLLNHGQDHKARLITLWLHGLDASTRHGLLSLEESRIQSLCSGHVFVEDVIIPIEQSNAITPIEESNASSHILTNLTDPTEDALKCYLVMQWGVFSRKCSCNRREDKWTFFEEKWEFLLRKKECFGYKMYALKHGDIAASVNTKVAANLLCPLFLTLLGFEPSLLLPRTPSWVIHGVFRVSLRYLFEMVTGHGEIEGLGRIEFSLLTGFSIGKVIFPKVKAGDIPPLVRRLFPEKVPGKYKRPKGVSYNVKGLELLDFVKDDEKWKNISDVDAVRVCLLLMAEHVFMGRETNHVMGKPIMMLAENLTAWDNFPWGEYFWTEFYGRTVNLVPKNRKKYSQQLKTDPLSKASYSINGFAWVWILETFPNSQRWWFKDDNVFLRCLAWGDTNNRFEKQNYGELLGEGSSPKVRLSATPDETNQEWWKRLHEYLDESLSAYENIENSENERGEYADLGKGVSSGADAGESSGEETVKEDKYSKRELELERLFRWVESRLHTVEMESTKLKEELAYLRKENDAPHEKALNVPLVNQELSYAADDLHIMALDEDAKVCTDEPKPSTTLHSFIPTDGVQFMALDEDAKVCIYEEPKPSTTLHSDIPADDVHSIPFDDDAKRSFTSVFGVITFYDSLGPGKEPKKRDWWVNLRKCLSLKIPTLVTLHVEVCDPVHTALAYREQLTDFFRSTSMRIIDGRSRQFLSELL